MQSECEVVIDVWGDFALFINPAAKIEQVNYGIPTASACRGILNAIYNKPKEFYYEIVAIDVMKPIQFVSVQKNEVKSKISSKISDDYYIDTDVNRTQRMHMYLTDVYYRIHAKMVVQKDAPPDISISRLRAQFLHRVEKGKCFYQPYLGTRECMCDFSLPDPDMEPIKVSKDFGTVLYDVFDIDNTIPLDTSKKSVSCKPHVRFFHACMEDGVIKLPTYASLS